MSGGSSGGGEDTASVRGVVLELNALMPDPDPDPDPSPSPGPTGPDNIEEEAPNASELRWDGKDVDALTNEDAVAPGPDKPSPCDVAENESPPAVVPGPKPMPVPYVSPVSQMLPPAPPNVSVALESAGPNPAPSPPILDAPDIPPYGDPNDEA